MISIHALLAESDSVRYDARLKAAEFLSTLSLRRATSKKYRVYYLTLISIHALLAESDRPRQIIIIVINNFYPRSPCGERPYITIITICIVSFLSTLSLRRATRFTTVHHTEINISIHALLAESDNGEGRN